MLILAPMAGVTDAPMREFLTARGGFDYCVTEFFRISESIPKPDAFVRHIPELALENGAKNRAKTKSGTSVQVQLLGGDPEKLANSALQAVKAGATSIDLNFGCPAPTVNRHDGGATLLKYPHRIRDIVHTMRSSLPKHIPVSAKLRLGWEDITDIHLNADMAAAGGADWITIHARTRMQNYRPPVFWEPIGQVRKRLHIPVVANGDIKTFDDFKRCRDITGCERFMIGRGALANPLLQHQISNELGRNHSIKPLDWKELFTDFHASTSRTVVSEGYTLRRIKQWLAFVNQQDLAPWALPLLRSNSLAELFINLTSVK